MLTRCAKVLALARSHRVMASLEAWPLLLEPFPCGTYPASSRRVEAACRRRWAFSTFLGLASFWERAMGT